MEYVMKYNFDEAVERRGTGCLKYDFAKERGKKEDVLPLWGLPIWILRLRLQ